jgi:hypothetical protein
MAPDSAFPWRSRSRLGFVQVAGLKLDHLDACNMFGALQTNEQLLDLIKLNHVPRQAIVWTLRAGHVNVRARVRMCSAVEEGVRLFMSRV